MTAKRKFQIATDMLMIVMLPFLMAYQLIGEAIHEWIGMEYLILIITFCMASGKADIFHRVREEWHCRTMYGS